LGAKHLEISFLALEKIDKKLCSQKNVNKRHLVMVAGRGAVKTQQKRSKHSLGSTQPT
jgi:hypothetical protein